MLLRFNFLTSLEDVVNRTPNENGLIKSAITTSMPDSSMLSNIEENPKVCNSFNLTTCCYGYSIACG